MIASARKATLNAASIPRGMKRFAIRQEPFAAAALSFLGGVLRGTIATAQAANVLLNRIILQACR
jgi:hypothetical protein